MGVYLQVKIFFIVNMRSLNCFLFEKLLKTFVSEKLFIFDSEQIYLSTSNLSKYVNKAFTPYANIVYFVYRQSKGFCSHIFSYKIIQGKL